MAQGARAQCPGANWVLKNMGVIVILKMFYDYEIIEISCKFADLIAYCRIDEG